MMADITDTLAQDSIAWSLVGENAEAEYEAWLENPGEAEHGNSVLDDPTDYFSEAIWEQEHNAAVLGDEVLQQKLAQEQERQPREQETGEQERPEEREQPEQAEPQEQHRKATEP